MAESDRSRNSSHPGRPAVRLGAEVAGRRRRGRVRSRRVSLREFADAHVPSHRHDDVRTADEHLERAIEHVDGCDQSQSGAAERSEHSEQPRGQHRRPASLMAATGSESSDVTVSAIVAEPDSNAGASVSNQVAVSAVNSRPALAAAAANAYAKAIIETRIEQQQQQLVKAQDAIKSQMAQFDTSASKLSTDYLLLPASPGPAGCGSYDTGDFTIVDPRPYRALPYTPEAPRSGCVRVRRRAHPRSRPRLRHRPVRHARQGPPGGRRDSRPFRRRSDPTHAARCPA